MNELELLSRYRHSEPVDEAVIASAVDALLGSCRHGAAAERSSRGLAGRLRDPSDRGCAGRRHWICAAHHPARPERNESELARPQRAVGREPGPDSQSDHLGRGWFQHHPLCRLPAPHLVSRHHAYAPNLGVVAARAGQVVTIRPCQQRGADRCLDRRLVPPAGRETRWYHHYRRGVDLSAADAPTARPKRQTHAIDQSHRLGGRHHLHARTNRHPTPGGRRN